MESIKAKAQIDDNINHYQHKILIIHTTEYSKETKINKIVHIST